MNPNGAWIGSAISGPAACVLHLQKRAAALFSQVASAPLWRLCKTAVAGAEARRLDCQQAPTEMPSVGIQIPFSPPCLARERGMAQRGPTAACNQHTPLIPVVRRTSLDSHGKG